LFSEIYKPGLAAHAVDYAMEEAKRFRHEFIGTEHLLLSVLRIQNNDSVSDLFREHRIDLKRARKFIKLIVGIGPSKTIKSQLTLTDRAVNAIRYSNSLSETNNTEWDMHHLFLGLIFQRDSVCVEILLSMGISKTQLDQMSKQD